MSRTHAKNRQHRRAVLTAVDFTEAQTTQRLANRLEIGYCALYQLLTRMEREGQVVCVPGRPVRWTRPG